MHRCYKNKVSHKQSSSIPTLTTRCKHSMGINQAALSPTLGKPILAESTHESMIPLALRLYKLCPIIVGWDLLSSYQMGFSNNKDVVQLATIRGDQSPGTMASPRLGDVSFVITFKLVVQSKRLLRPQCQALLAREPGLSGDKMTSKAVLRKAFHTSTVCLHGV